MCFSVFLFGLVLNGTLHFLGLDDCFLSHVREIFSYYCLQICSQPLCHSLSFWDLYNVKIYMLGVIQQSLKLSLFHFVLFSFSDFHHLCVLVH